MHKRRQKYIIKGKKKMQVYLLGSAHKWKLNHSFLFICPLSSRKTKALKSSASPQPQHPEYYFLFSISARLQHTLMWLHCSHTTPVDLCCTPQVRSTSTLSSGDGNKSLKAWRAKELPYSHELFMQGSQFTRESDWGSKTNNIMQSRCTLVKTL